MSEEFTSRMRDLFDQVDELRSNHDQFGKKIDIILQIFSLIEENMSALSSSRFRNFLQVVIRKCDSFLLEAKEVYNRLNSEKRLSPETKCSYRQLVATLPPLKARFQQILLEVEMSVQKKETEVALLQPLRSSKRLSMRSSKRLSMV